MSHAGKIAYYEDRMNIALLLSDQNYEIETLVQKTKEVPKDARFPEISLMIKHLVTTRGQKSVIVRIVSYGIPAKEMHQDERPISENMLLTPEVALLRFNP